MELANMKKEIHPEMKECKVSCACGNSFTTRAVSSELKIDICNVCHPFFTGKMKFIDTEGRVDKFMRKYGKK
jgi:large subunit ribosomal protein L31